MRILSKTELDKVLLPGVTEIVNLTRERAEPLAGCPASQLAATLSQKLGLLFACEFDAQDRSDYAQIVVPEKLTLHSPWRVEIRLSFQSPLVSIFGERFILPAERQKIENTILELGFIFVAESIFLGPSGTDHVEDKATGQVGYLRNELWYQLFDYA